MAATSFDPVERLADAVLYEGYVLYPYRASSAKNQFRWQFGVVAPQAPGSDGEPWFAQTECLIEHDGSPQLSIRVRFLRPRPAEHADAPGGWLEGAVHACDVEPIGPADLCGECTQALTGAGLDAAVVVSAQPLARFLKVRIRLENREPWQQAFDGDRDAMLRRSLVGAHLLLAVSGGAFISLLEPPADAAEYASACSNRHTWPVLVGASGTRGMMLSSPIVLYDYPSVAAASKGDLCDAAEIDEILSLRILTMTEDEKREARATDPRSRAIVDRVDALTSDDMAAMHGIVRTADFFNPPGTPPPGEASVTVNGRCVAKGSKVRLHPNRRADAMDMFLADQSATVAGVYRDVDDRVHVAVTIDADPAAALHQSFGRYFYFDPAEIEPMDSWTTESGGLTPSGKEQERRR